MAKRENKKHVETYASVAELSAALRNAESLPEWGDYSCKTKSDSRQKDWAGETYNDAFTKLDLGDEDKAAKIKAQGEILAEPNTGYAPKIELSVRGCVPSVPNYLRGVPNNMMHIQREPMKFPVIDLYVDTAIYDGIDVNKVAKEAAVLANVITATEQVGVRVNLYAMCGAKGGEDRKYAMIVKIKEADSPLNLLNVGFSLCNRAFCRIIFLRWIETHVPEKIWSYGRPVSGKECQEWFNLDGIVFSIGDMVSHETTVEEVTERINEYINNQNNNF